MPTLQSHLQTLSHYSLRGIAIRLDVRQSHQNRKRAWQEGIQAGWQSPPTRQTWLALLSADAQAALSRLLQAQPIPAALFWATYGAVRQVTAKQHWDPPPWQAPATVSEELYYSGLLAAEPGASLRKAKFVTPPDDLRSLLSATLLAHRQVTKRQGDTEMGRQGDSDSLTSDSLCHDIAQLLIFLHQGQGQRLLHDRWLSPTQLQQLNARLLQPQPPPLPPSHKQADRLAWLIFLATAAGLQNQGHLTPLAWAWLAAPPNQQQQQLWQAWQQATPELRTAYHQPDAHLSPPWPQLLLPALAQTNTRFTATDLANALLAQTDHQAWLIAHFVDLAAVDQLVAALLAGPLTALGLVAPLTPQTEGSRQSSEIRNPDADRTLSASGNLALHLHYRLTATGAWLLQRTAGLPPSAPAPAIQSRSANLQTQDDRWLVTVPAPNDATLLGQAQLAAYAHCQAPPLASPLTHHSYWLTPATVAHAAATGHGMATLLAAFAHLRLVLTPPQITHLHHWHAQGQQLRLELLPVLRTQQPAQMAALYQHPDLATRLGELLSPTVAVVPTDLAAIRRHLCRAGFHPAAVGAPVEPADHADEDPVPPPNWGRLGGGGGALWLAGQLYALLGEHLELPVPAPYSALTGLFQQLSPAEQAVVQAQRQQLHDGLLALLDALPFTPPSQPSDPAQWLPQLEAASRTQAHLTLTYFSAGRNLPTRRLVQPYWVEEHHGVPYLRAYCHQAGRVLTFRLDRITALAVAASEQTAVPCFDDAPA